MIAIVINFYVCLSSLAPLYLISLIELPPAYELPFPDFFCFFFPRMLDFVITLLKVWILLSNLKDF